MIIGVNMNKVSVIGLGYVGIQMATALSKYNNVVGYDINVNKIENYNNGIDLTGEIGENFKDFYLNFTSDPNSIKDSDFFIVCVPTPSNEKGEVDTSYVESACLTIEDNLKQGSIVIFESTVYIGATKLFCIPILEKNGKKCGEDFFVAFSPERINPGDKNRNMFNIDKIIGCENNDIAEKIKNLYNQILEKCHIINSIEVAEASKLLENVQRDVNIALINEISILFDKLGIDTYKVIDAASTKWNFLNFKPGLVGGHCIGVDTNYLLKNADDLKIKLPLSVNARYVNEMMPQIVAEKIFSIIKTTKKQLKILVLGLTYKSNVPDFRNSKVFDLINILEQKNIRCILHDPFEDYGYIEKYYHKTKGELCNVDYILLAVPHEEYINNLEKYANYIKSKFKIILTLSPIKIKNKKLKIITVL